MSRCRSKTAVARIRRCATSRRSCARSTTHVRPPWSARSSAAPICASGSSLRWRTGCSSRNAAFLARLSQWCRRARALLHRTSEALDASAHAVPDRARCAKRAASSTGDLRGRVCPLAGTAVADPEWEPQGLQRSPGWTRRRLRYFVRPTIFRLRGFPSSPQNSRTRNATPCGRPELRRASPP